MDVGRCTGSVGNDDVELEAMRKDSSWHPCHVSLRSTGLGLIVQYKDNDFEEIIEDKEGVLARIRVRSSPLQRDDCSSVQQGDHVLATKNSNVNGIFYDARVEEAIRVRHSKRIHCRCTFRIKWIHQVIEGEALTLPASAIMNLARKNINLHPTISAFFSMVKNPSDMDELPFSSPGDGMDWEMDINVLLERQIKEISHSSDVPGKKVCQKIMLGLEVDVTGQCQDKATDASFNDLSIRTPTVSNWKGSTGSNNKHSVITTIGKPPASTSSVQEELRKNVSPLNPLAALAALASLRSSKFPQNAELSRTECGHSSVSYEFSLIMSATLEGKNPKYEGIVKTLFPNSNTSELSNEPPKEQAKEMRKINQNSIKKIIHHSETKVTRAQTQRNSRKHESAQITDTKEVQLRSSSKTRKVAPSTINGAENSELNESNKANEENMSSKLAKLECDSEVNTPAEIGKSFLGKDGLVINQNSSKRVTRSAALDCAKKNDLLPEPRLRKRKSCESNGLKLEEDIVISKKNNPELKESTLALSAAKISLQCTVEREKKIPNTSETVVSVTQGIKKKPANNSKAQERRSSPRLNFLPKTRSQTRAWLYNTEA